jgi:hypothetical protein
MWSRKCGQVRTIRCPVGTKTTLTPVRIFDSTSELLECWPARIATRSVAGGSTAPIWNCTPRPRGWECFQGEFRGRNPGLKHWAVLLDHFMVKNW